MNKKITQATAVVEVFLKKCSKLLLLSASHFGIKCAISVSCMYSNMIHAKSFSSFHTQSFNVKRTEHNIKMVLRIQNKVKFQRESFFVK